MSLLPVALAVVLQAAPGAPAPRPPLSETAPVTPSPAAAEQGEPADPAARPPAEVVRDPVNVGAERTNDANVTAYPPDFFANARPNTALDMVNRLPGFAFDGGQSARGFAGTAGNVLIDGTRPASKTDALSSVLSRIPASRVERIEVIRGGAPGVDMQGRSVVANVVRRAGDALQQTLSASASVFTGDGRFLPGLSYEVTRQAGHRSYEGSISRTSSFDDSTGKGRRVRRDAGGVVFRDEFVGNEGDGADLDGKSAVKTPLMGGELRVNGSLSKSDFKSEAHFDGNLGRFDVANTDDSLSGEVGGNYTRPLGARWSTEVIALQKLGRSEAVSDATRPDRRPGGRDVFTSDVETGESIGRAVLKHRRSDALSVEAGGEAAFNFREGLVAFTQDGAVQEIPSSQVRVEERRGEAFVLANWRPLARLALELGSRFETSTIGQSGSEARERSFFYPKPRLLATWSPNTRDQFRLRVEREVGQLDFGDFVSSANLTTGVVAAGNPELEPDKTTVVELTGERRFWDTGALVVTLRRETITDAIDRVPVFTPNGDVFDAPGNIGDGDNDELEVDLTLPLRRLGITGGELKAELEWSRSEVTDPTTGETRRISGQRPNDIEFTYRHDLPSRNLTFEAIYFNGWEEAYYRFDEVERFDLSPFLAAQVDYKPRPDTTLTFELSNLARFDFRRRREVLTGPRDVSPIAFTEVRENRSQITAFVRLRRTLGG